MKPPCVDWSVWIGREVEGTEGLGELTLFVRRFNCPSFVGAEKRLSALLILVGERNAFTRIWFCKEFKDWDLIRAFLRKYPDVPVSVESNTLMLDTRTPAIPEDINQKVRVYFKSEIILKPRDFFCLGPAFNDEAFQVGSGAKVTPEHYLKDECIF